MDENAAGFLLLLLVLLLAGAIITVMSYVSILVLNSPRARGKPKRVAIVLGLAFFLALSDCALPVALLVSSDNRTRGPLVIVIIVVALIMGTLQGISATQLLHLQES